MRLGSSPVFTPSAARRVLRDLGDQTERLFQLVEADSNGLKTGVKVMDLSAIRTQIAAVQAVTPRSSLESPLSGEEIMEATGIESGPDVGRLKTLLTEKVLDGELEVGDKEGAIQILQNLSS